MTVPETPEQALESLASEINDADTVEMCKAKALELFEAWEEL
jgi:hypothetical protein